MCCSVSFGVTVTRFKERSWSGEGGDGRGWEGQRRREGKEEWGGKERVRQKKRAGKEGEGWELDNGKRYTTTQKIDGDIGR